MHSIQGVITFKCEKYQYIYICKQSTFIIHYTMLNKFCTLYMSHVKCDLPLHAKNHYFLQKLTAEACELEGLMTLIRVTRLTKGSYTLI